MSGNVCKQTSLEIPEVTCTRCTIMGFLHETSLIWVISLEMKLWLVYFRSLHIYKNHRINAKYMINVIKVIWILNWRIPVVRLACYMYIQLYTIINLLQFSCLSHDITEILLKVALNTLTLTLTPLVSPLLFSGVVSSFWRHIISLLPFGGDIVFVRPVCPRQKCVHARPSTF